MKSKLIQMAVLVFVLAAMGCRPMMFWREPMIHGDTRLIGDNGQPIDGVGEPIILNFIQLDGNLEDTLVSVETGPLGQYISPKLFPGNYAVEAMLPGFVIEKQVVEVRSHEHKRVDFTLYRIGEAEGRSLAEAEELEIAAPGQVQIGPPNF
jgi:hypothetical protein